MSREFPVWESPMALLGEIDNHWLEIDLEGVISNRDGIGAKVYITAGGKTQLRQIENLPVDQLVQIVEPSKSFVPGKPETITDSGVLLWQDTFNGVFDLRVVEGFEDGMNFT